ncbi:HEPN domain-containing protein [Candidatus Woesearchaeota archaeon]|nr:HEPN domain-containing protein [Candidatus Woesearchaeota archaeon]
MNKEIKKDIERAKQALESAQRNLKEGDILTAANRNFIACENAIYVLLKSKFGSTSISRMKILTKLEEIDPSAKEAYDSSYDLRVQADYGRESRAIPLNKESLENSLESVNNLVEKAKKVLEKNKA